MPAATAPTSNGTERGPLVITGIEFALQQNLPDGWWKAGNEPRRRLQVYRPRGFRPAGVYCRQRPLPRGVVGEESGDGGRRHDERPILLVVDDSTPDCLHLTSPGLEPMMMCVGGATDCPIVSSDDISVGLDILSPKTSDGCLSWSVLCPFFFCLVLDLCLISFSLPMYTV